MDITTTLALGAAGLCAGFIDAIAGGGGLISLPALLWAGLPPHRALGTNKLQSAVGTSMAVHRYHAANLIDWKEMPVAVAATAIAAALGTLAVLWVDNRALRFIVPWLLLAVAIHVLRRPALAAVPTEPRLSANRFGAVAGSVLGFYDGFFGPGAGAFWTAACVHLRGMSLPHAIAFTKVVNLTSNLAALLVFSAWGQVDAEAAVAMIAGQAIGGRLGAGLAVKHGAPFIRIVFAGVVFSLVARLFWQAMSG